VFLEMMGHQGTPTVWTCYDNFRVEGGELANGDFETLDAKGLPHGWRMPSGKDLPPLVISDARRAASGSKAVLASHDFRVVQPIRVKAGQKVNVQFQARGLLGE
jgi:hypothetical protein